MSFTMSNLTWDSIKLQSFIENPDISEIEKNDLIDKHLTSLNEIDPLYFPEFDSGWEWFNTERSLSVAKDFVNHIVIADFFTYCCINCMHILPDLEAIEKKYPEETGVIVVGIHSAKFENEKVSSNIMAAVQRYNINHPVVNDSQAVLWKKLEVTCWPTLVILGPDSRALFVIIGEGHGDVLFRYVERCLVFFEKQIQPSQLPLLFNSSVTFQSHLLFPGKVSLIKLPLSEHSLSDLDSDQTYLAISDTGHHRIVITSLQGEIKMTFGRTMGFQDGCEDKVKFHSPQGTVFYPPHFLYVADTGNHSIRQINLKTKTTETVAGTGLQGSDKEGNERLGKEQTLASPWDVCLTPSPGNREESDMLLIANAGTHQIWGLALKDLTWWKAHRLKAGQCVRIAGSGAEENRNNCYPAKAAFAQPSGLCLAGDVLFVADSESSSIRQMSLKDGAVKAVVGGDRDPSNLFRFGDKDNDVETKAAVLLQHPLAVSWNADRKLLYVADSYNHKIKSVDPSMKISKTLVGNGKAGMVNGTIGLDQIQMNEPGGLCFNPEDNSIYVADTNNHCIRKIDLSANAVETVNVTVKVTKEGANDEVDEVDYVKSIGLLSLDSDVEWCLKFVCPPNCKWSEGAPHKWKIVSSGNNLKFRETAGKVCDGEVLIHLYSSVSNIQMAAVQVQADLYICGIDSGTCTQKTVMVQLNFDESLPFANQVIQHEFII